MAGIFKTTKKFATSSNESITLDIKHKEMLNKKRMLLSLPYSRCQMKKNDPATDGYSSHLEKKPRNMK